MSRSELIGHPRELRWRMKNKELVSIKHMETSHLVNAINFMKDSNKNFSNLKKGMPEILKNKIHLHIWRYEFYMRVMKAELEYRKKYGWPEEQDVCQKF